MAPVVESDGPDAVGSEPGEDLAVVKATLERVTAIFAHAPDYVLAVDENGTLTYINRPAPGKSLADMVGTPVEQWMEPPARPAFRTALAEVFRTREVHSYESVGAVSGRSYVNRMSPIVRDGVVLAAVLVTHDVTERVVAEQRLLESEQRFRMLSELPSEGVMLSVQGRIVATNGAVSRIFGYAANELLGLSPVDLTTPESGAIVSERIRAGDERPYEITALAKGGEAIPVELRGRNVEWAGQRARVTTIVDLRERRRIEADRRRLETRTREAEKLETLGALAGGVAHDFNNFLQAILINAEIAAKRVDDQTAQTSLQQIQTVVMDARNLVQQLRLYAGASPSSSDLVDVGELLRGSSELLRLSVPRHVEFVLRDPGRAGFVRGDRTQLQQVLLNLVVNAGEAMEGRTGSVVVTAECRRWTADELQGCAVDATKGPAQYVSISVRDEGAGMPRDTVHRVLEPFFSTKFPGRGLGLATVAGIVRNHGGALRITSAPETGSAFEVALPEEPADGASTHDPIAQDRRDAPLPSNPTSARRATIQARVLLADDEELVRIVVQKVLTLAGATVVTAHRGDVAKTTFEQHRAVLDAALLDVTMPGADGLEVAEHIRRIDPTFPIVLMSGFSDAASQLDLEALGVEFVPKPAAADTIVAALRTAIERRRKT